MKPRKTYIDINFEERERQRIIQNILAIENEENIESDNECNDSGSTSLIFNCDEEKDEEKTINEIKLGDVVSMKSSNGKFDCFAIIANIFRVQGSHILYCQVYWLVPMVNIKDKEIFKIEDYKILPFKDDIFELKSFTFIQELPDNSPYKIKYALNGEIIEEDLKPKVKKFDWENTCFNFLEKDDK
uniref:BAH domain-containing protein n=1 Tax=Parastrongyloides trichosuri TaxID=131310 RepID=A0A0N5A5F2_PARTI